MCAPLAGFAADADAAVCHTADLKSCSQPSSSLHELVTNVVPSTESDSPMTDVAYTAIADVAAPSSPSDMANNDIDNGTVMKSKAASRWRTPRAVLPRRRSLRGAESPMLKQAMQNTLKRLDDMSSPKLGGGGGGGASLASAFKGAMQASRLMLHVSSSDGDRRVSFFMPAVGGEWRKPVYQPSPDSAERLARRHGAILDCVRELCAAKNEAERRVACGQTADALAHVLAATQEHMYMCTAVNRVPDRIDGLGAKSTFKKFCKPMAGQPSAFATDRGAVAAPVRDRLPCEANIAMLIDVVFASAPADGLSVADVAAQGELATLSVLAALGCWHPLWRFMLTR